MVHHEERTARDLEPIDHVETMVEYMSAAKYVVTRVSSLKLAMEKAANPLESLAVLNTKQWLFFSLRFLRGPGTPWIFSQFSHY
jgi:hypothetical protein